jgi:sugar phosphate isomerase/epimerase
MLKRRIAMKLSTSTGDFSFYVNKVSDKIRLFKDTKFKNLNFEQCGDIPELYSDNDDDWKRFADECGQAAEFAGVKLVVSHSPCLHFAVPEALNDRENEAYKANLKALRRSLMVCNELNIPRTVVHACIHKSFDKKTFYRYNKMFYRDLLDLAERFEITIMTENWDNDDSLFSTGRDLGEFIDEVDHPLLCACWDTAHGNLAAKAKEVGQYNNIICLKDKLKGMHLSDNFGDVHHHSWPFAGIINFDEVLSALIDVGYDGYFNFEASYTLLHHKNMPYNRKPWIRNGETVTKLLDPTVELKQKAIDLLYDIGQHVLKTYDIFEP